MKKIIFLILTTLSFSFIHAQEKVYLPYFETLNMNYEYGITATRVFKAYVNQDNKFDIILPERIDSVSGQESFNEIRDKAQALNTKYFIKGELSRLGETVLVSIALYKTEDGTKVWSDLQKARNPDDLDPIILKLSRTIGTTKKASDQTDIYTVTEYESNQLRQVRSNTYLGFSIGGAFINSPFPSSANPAGFGMTISHDMRTLIADLSGEIYFGPNALYFASISGYYPFKSTSNTPYLGGGLGLGGVSVPDPASTFNEGSQSGGLMLFAGGGYLLNRTSNVRFRAGAKAFMPLFKVKDTVPFGAVINLEIAFGK